MSVPVEIIALHRIGFGPRAGDVERVGKMGLAAYLEEQLRPDDANDPLCAEKLAAVRMHIEYDAGKDDKGVEQYPACKEDRPLKCLDQPLSDLWKRADDQVPQAGEERSRPLAEIKAATWVRAIFSRWQLREVLVDFWHNHFNVNTGTDDGRIAALWPIYDRDVIRKHALGNFRQFLEAVATSLPMLSYLNNATSKASPANENYARELFELHSLGAQSYYNHLYNRWRDVPGATDGKPIGYIDQDVYEAARAFTGWTIADGTDSGRGETFPRTGAFHYCDGWHDNYQKRVLGVEFDPNQPPMADGRKVLDLIAAHPATARHVCAKLCRRLVCDDPPEELVKTAVEAWTAALDKPDQIARTVRAIVLSPEFAATFGQRVKRPFDSVVAFLRGTGADVKPGDALFGLVERMGQRLFSWPAPTGHPEASGYWLGTNAMLGRWNSPLALLGDSGIATFRLIRESASADTWRKLCGYWAVRLLGRPLDDASMKTLVDFAAGGGSADETIASGDAELVDRLHAVVALIAMTPDFQMC